jgi:hypothetical protein
VGEFRPTAANQADRQIFTNKRDQQPKDVGQDGAQARLGHGRIGTGQGELADPEQTATGPSVDRDARQVEDVGLGKAYGTGNQDGVSGRTDQGGQPTAQPCVNTCHGLSQRRGLWMFPNFQYEQVPCQLPAGR